MTWDPTRGGQQGGPYGPPPQQPPYGQQPGGQPPSYGPQPPLGQQPGYGQPAQGGPVQPPQPGYPGIPGMSQPQPAGYGGIGGPPGGGSNKAVAVIIAVVVAVVLAVGAWLLIRQLNGGEGGTTGANPGDVESPTEIRDTDLSIGNCIGALEHTASGLLPQVPCADDHEAEVIAEDTMDDGDYPGEDETRQQAEDFCPSAVGEQVGSVTGVSTYMLYPTDNTWGGGDRLITCLVRADDEHTLTGSFIAGDGSAD